MLHRAWLLSFAPLLLCAACGQDDAGSPPGEDPSTTPTRLESLPADAVKMTPETDHFPPLLLLPDEFEAPVPLDGPVNTAGIEDAPVISADGSRLIFFFTPDGEVPPSLQVLDRVTGVWQAVRTQGGWTEPERVLLCDDLALDGPVCLQGDTLWFASFRAGNYGEGDIYTAVLRDNRWQDWSNAGHRLNADLDIGECWILPGGDELIYDAVAAGGQGGQDLWRVPRLEGGWGEPQNLGAPLNTGLGDSRPALAPDGDTLWYTHEGSASGHGPSIWRAHRTAEGWSSPEEVVTGYVGDPGIDASGDLYFTHLFYDAEGRKIEADIYVCRRR